MKQTVVKRMTWMVLVAVALSGCGVAETAATGAANAKAAADEAREGKKTEERVQAEVDAAMAKDAAQRKAAEDKAADGQ
jgi:hypothetical protein